MDVIFILFILGLGFLFLQSFRSQLSENNFQVLRLLFFYHFLFGVYFCFFVFGDAIGYWNHAKVMTEQQFLSSITESQGTFFIFALNYIPSSVLGLSYLSGTMLYSLIGFIGFTYFFITAVTLIPGNPRYRGYDLFPALFFLPNLHFWSCGVGKDTLLFFCIGIFVHGLMKPYRRLPLLIVALTLAYLVRPHIVLMMLLGFGIAYFSGKGIPLFRRVLFFSAMLGLAVVLLPLVLKFSKIEEASIDSFSKFSNAKASVLSGAHARSAVDISSYPFPLKVFTFLYRPTFIDITGIPAALAALENLLLLALTVTFLRNRPLHYFRQAPFVIQGMIYFLIIGTLLFSQSLGNLGITIRMRNMFLPGMIIFFLWYYALPKEAPSKA
ncbi:MAG TPA: hypothetical protein VK183_07260 [Flavobacterium sp.]|nr:hypothetical protein [Flavobacterium sp.]